MNTKMFVQNFGRFLSNMVMPNIGAFIAWGFLTALFIPTGWMPNAELSKMVGPMIINLLPILIGYTGGKLMAGERGAVVGAVATMGVIVGTDIPMFMGAMIVGPFGGWAIKKFDQIIAGKIKSGFEMLVNNFSAGIIGMLCAMLAFWLIGPFVKTLSTAMAGGVDLLVNAGLLPLTSIFVEPAKILFLNNAINHGIFTPLGIQQTEEFGKSMVFLIEANPGPGMGILLAYMFFGSGSAKQSAAGASIIHFFGGIHEIYFPYVLMNPRLLLAAIAGGMTGVFTLTIFDAGLVAPASPGSIIAVLLMAPESSIIGVLISVTAAASVSFFVASLLIKKPAYIDDNEEEEEEDVLEKANALMNDMKATSKNIKAPVLKELGIGKELDLKTIKKVIVACDAGMGSSAIGAGILMRMVEKENFPITVLNVAISDLPNDVDIVITHENLTDLAKAHAPNASHISLTNFLDNQTYTSLVTRIKEARQ